MSIDDPLALLEARFELIRACARTVRPLVVFTLNLPRKIAGEAEVREAAAAGAAGAGTGSIAPLLPRLFARGLDLLDALGVAGPPRLVDDRAMFALVGAPGCDARRLKADLCAREEGRPEGRLYDFDVIDDPSGMPVTRESLGRAPRPCLVCGGETLRCRREDHHPAEELAAAVRRRLHGAGLSGARPREREIAALGVAALAFELLVEPKPGLVCPGTSGSHRDMNAFTFARSLATFFPWLEECARTGAAAGPGFSHDPPDADAAGAYARLKARGVPAEEAMFRATGGVNTHKGLVYSLGLLSAGAGACGARNGTFTAEEAAEAAGRLSASGVARELARTGRTGEPATRGERVYLATGLAGARGEAAAGFPTVLSAALPRLREAADDFGMNAAGVRALVALFSACDDTNLLGKDPDAHAAFRALAHRAAADGGALPELAAFLGARGLSPGGAADLLACGFFLLLAERSFRPGREGG